MTGHLPTPLRSLAGCLLAGLAVVAVTAQGPSHATTAPGQPAQRKAGPATPGGVLSMDQLVDIRHPSNPSWSRDSRWIVFSWERAGVANLYIVPADGSAAPRPLTTDGEPATGVFWGADNRSVYFFRAGNLVQVPADGSQPPRPVWTQPPGRSLAVAKDGNNVAYLAGNAGGPGPGGRGGQASAQNDARTISTAVHVRSLVDGSDRVVATVDGPVAALAWTGDGQALTYTTGTGPQMVRHDQSPAYSGAKIIYTTTEFVPGPPGQSFVVPLSGGAPRAFNAGPGGGFGGRGGAASRWMDGSHFVTDRVVEFKRREIYAGDTLGGEPKLLHQGVKQTFWSMTGGAQGAPQASPDGRWISFLSDRDGWDHLYVMPASGGEPVRVTKGEFEAWRPAWSPDGARIAFDSNEGPNPGSRHIGIADIGSNPGAATVRTVTTGRGADIQPAWSPDGTRLVYQHTDPQNSADLWVVNVSSPGSRPVRLTDSMPPGINRTALVEPKLVHYAGPDGKRVPAYLFVPENLDRSKRHPAIVWIHGDGVNQNYDGWHVERNYAVYYSFHQYLLQRGYVVIAPDYRGSIGYGSAWREGVYMDVGGKDFRDAALSAKYLETLPYVDAARIGVWGLSYGGFFTLLAVTEMPTVFRAAVDVAGVADYAMYYEDPYHGGWTASRIGTPEQNPAVYAQASPLSHVDRLERPLLVLHGTADVNVPYLHSVRLIDELLKKGKGPLVEFMTYPGEFHYFTREHVLRDAWTRVSAFFDEHLR